MEEEAVCLVVAMVWEPNHGPIPEGGEWEAVYHRDETELFGINRTWGSKCIADTLPCVALNAPLQADRNQAKLPNRKQT